MNILFGLPILIGIILGLTWPYYALELNQYTIYILFFMTVLSLSRIDFNALKRINKHKIPLFMSLFVHYFIAPCLVWLVAHFILRNESLRLGFFWAALTPTALFVPTLITKNIDSEQFEISTQFLILSMIIMPAPALLMSNLFFEQAIPLNLRTYLTDVILVTTIPILLVFVLTKIPNLQKLLKLMSLKLVHISNMFLVGTLSYIFLGTAILKLNFGTLDLNEQIAVVAMSVAFNFLIYFLIPIFLKKLVDVEYFQSMRVCLSVRNVAIAGSLLLFYRPQSVLAIVGIFLSHWIFISVFNKLGKWKH